MTTITFKHLILPYFLTLCSLLVLRVESWWLSLFFKIDALGYSSVTVKKTKKGICLRYFRPRAVSELSHRWAYVVPSDVEAVVQCPVSWLFSDKKKEVSVRLCDCASLQTQRAQMNSVRQRNPKKPNERNWALSPAAPRAVRNTSSPVGRGWDPGRRVHSRGSL